MNTTVIYVIDASALTTYLHVYQMTYLATLSAVMYCLFQLLSVRDRVPSDAFGPLLPAKQRQEWRQQEITYLNLMMINATDMILFYLLAYFAKILDDKVQKTLSRCSPKSLFLTSRTSHR